MTIGVEYGARTVTVGSRSIKLQIWVHFCFVLCFAKLIIILGYGAFVQFTLYF